MGGPIQQPSIKTVARVHAAEGIPMIDITEEDMAGAQRCFAASVGKYGLEYLTEMGQAAMGGRARYLGLFKVRRVSRK